MDHTLIVYSFVRFFARKLNTAKDNSHTTIIANIHQRYIKRKHPKRCNLSIRDVYSYPNSPAAEAEDVVLHAFETGYRHVSLIPFPVISIPNKYQIDSARAYRNEGPCADAVRKSWLARSEIFFTSKVPPRVMGYEKTTAAVNSSFHQTGLDYIDLLVLTFRFRE